VIQDGKNRIWDRDKHPRSAKLSASGVSGVSDVICFGVLAVVGVPVVYGIPVVVVFLAVAGVLSSFC
jgi:hypothetical protein